MIQFNLLPDIKLEYISARRSKRMVLLVSMAVTGVSLVVFVGLFLIVNVLQTKRIHDLNGDITKYTATLKATPDLDKVLTVQNQLNNLTALHDQKPVSTRLLDYLGQVTPAQATISNVSLDYGASTLSLTGDADTLSTINKYVDTLKFTEYSVAGTDGSKKAFSNVVLGSFSSGGQGQRATYQISFSFDPTIFDGTKQVTLAVPKIISTRSEVDKPGDLFQQSTQTKQQ